MLMKLCLLVSASEEKNPPDGSGQNEMDFRISYMADSMIIDQHLSVQLIFLPIKCSSPCVVHQLPNPLRRSALGVPTS